MTYSHTCIEERQREIEKTRKLITVAVVGSVVFHAIALSMIGNNKTSLLKQESKPIELIIVQEEAKPNIKPEKPKPKPTPETKQKLPLSSKLKEITPPKPQATQKVKANISQPQATQKVKANTSQPQATQKVKANTSQAEIAETIPLTPSQEITSLPKNTNSIVSESNPLNPTFTTPNRSQVENIAPLTPQEVLTTNNTLARNNISRGVKPVENQNSSNSWSNSLKSSSNTISNNNNSNTSITRVSEDIGVSSGRISRGNSKTPNAIVSNNTLENISGLGNNSSRNNNRNTGSNNQVSPIASNVANTSQSIPQRPQPKPNPNPSPEGIKCISNCNPAYPSQLQGIEGKTTVKINLDSSGNVSGVNVVNPHSNSEINRQALLAARKMRFSPPGNNNAFVQVTINFTVAGSEFDKVARQKKDEQERQARLAQEKERQARQAQLEQERVQRQQQLEKERKEREIQAQLEREKKENSSNVAPLSNVNNSENKSSLELENLSPITPEDVSN